MNNNSINAHTIIIHKIMEVNKMEGNQKIYCTVETCKYNNEQNNECNLQTIKVTPIQNCKTQKADESQCSSYEYEKN